MMIRKPISRPMRIGLGCVAIVVLVAAYSLLSYSRATAKRGEAAEKLENVRGELSRLESQRTTASPSGRGEREQARIESLRARVASLEGETKTAIDRAVPTWGSLYRDGWLRVITPQGLRQDEYWLWEDAQATACRLLAGLFVGILLSVILGILMGSFSVIEALCVPPLSFLTKIPPTAMLAAFFVLVGTSFRMYVTMIAFGTLPTLAQTIYQSAKKDVPDTLINKASTLGASQPELIWNVIFKQILPRLIDAIRLQVGPALVLLIAAEWMVSGEGFGYRLRLFYQRTDMSVVYLYTFILGAVGLVVDYALTWFRRLLCPWFGE